MYPLAPKDFVHSPEAMARPCTVAEAESYTRRLATGHYENFHVVSFLLPRRLHQDFYNVYSFCRWSDDLGDEMGDPQESLRLLGWWRELLESLYRGEPQTHPVYVALGETIRRHDIPEQLFGDLIHAFVMDQTVTRYRNWDELFEYCRYSANPVGRLVLHLCGYRDAERCALSDATCTALQLANHWQDVAVDLEKNRIYLPLDLLEQHGSGAEDVTARKPTPAFRAAMREAVDRAEALFLEGLPLVRMVDRQLAIDLDLFSRGGMRVLAKIREQGYDTLTSRPVISTGERAGILFRALWRAVLPRAA
jgi:squalene synthase HpnC